MDFLGGYRHSAGGIRFSKSMPNARIAFVGFLRHIKRDRDREIAPTKE